MLRFSVSTFSELSTQELFEILRIRSEVFVVEQQCAYNDPDEFDCIAAHVVGYAGIHLAAYARVLPPGSRFAEPSIGRVLSAQNFRRQGAGREVMRQSIATALDLFDRQPIRISAQLYLQRFYEELGFIVASEPYLEDNIPHIEMTLSPGTR